MNLVEVVILLGAQCLSPIESAPGFTEVAKVPCAVMVRHDPRTDDIEFVPPTAATDPRVIAMLVKPRGDAPVIKSDRLASAADADITGSITQAPHIVPASAEVDPEDIATPTAKTKTRAAVARKRVALTSRRGDLCGAQKAVWYTNKDGRRKYRCVKSG